MSIEFPQIEAVRALQARLADWLVETPVIRCAALEKRLGGEIEIHGKLEFLQGTGTFKLRGALATLSSLSPEQLGRGVTAVSAGNHAIATAYAATVVGTSAKVVMLRSASPVRIQACRDHGAEVVLAENVHSAFETAQSICEKEQRFLVHPFEGPQIAAGTATLGLELCDQLREFDAVVVPIGGGGLCGGLSWAIKQLRQGCRVYGVEPTGADSMRRSFAAGKPMSIEGVRTIADSLGAPYALPYSYGLCRAFVDELVQVDDIALKQAMSILFHDQKIAVEPACAASTAALLGPLAEKLRGRKVVLIFCGSNVDWATFARDAVPEYTIAH